MNYFPLDRDILDLLHLKEKFLSIDHIYSPSENHIKEKHKPFSVKKTIKEKILKKILSYYYLFYETNVVDEDDIEVEAKYLKNEIYEIVQRILNYHKKMKTIKENINSLFQKVNIIKEKYKLLLDNYNFLEVFPEELKLLLQKKMLLLILSG